MLPSLVPVPLGDLGCCHSDLRSDLQFGGEGPLRALIEVVFENLHLHRPLHHPLSFPMLQYILLFESDSGS